MDIVEEIRQNPESGARRLAAEYKAGLMTLARRFCNDPGDAEELVNATFAAVVENIESHLEQASFFGWMCQILTSLHSRNVRRKSHGDIVYPGVVPDAIDEKAQQEIYDNLDHSLVREAIGKLTKEERDLLIMHYFMDMPVAQMAKVLALPSGTIMSKLYYARKALAAKLGVAAKKPGVKATLLALALCATAALGAVWWSELSERAASGESAGPRSRAAANGGTGETGETSGSSPIAPVPPDSPVPPVADVLFVPDVPSTLSSGEQNMNTTTLRSIAASAAIAAAIAATPTTATADDAYVESDGTTIVNTGVLPTPDMKIEVDYAFTAIETDARLFGVYVGGGQNAAYYVNSSKGLAFHVGKGWVGGTYLVMADLNRHTVVFDIQAGKVHSLTGSVTNKTASTKSTPGLSAEGNVPIALFGRMAGANGSTNDAVRAKARIYGAKFYKGGALVCNLVPCVKGDVAGFRDTVGGHFHSAEFNVVGLSAGGNVERIPDDGYIELAGNDQTLADGEKGGHFFDTGYTPGPNTRIEFDYALAANRTGAGDWYLLQAGNSTETVALYQTANAIGACLGTAMWKGVGLPSQANAAFVRRTAIFDSQNKAVTMMTAGYANYANTNNVFTAFSGNAANSIVLGATAGKGGGYTPIRIYGLKIYESGSLVREYVPYVKNGAPGMKYDDKFVRLYWAANNGKNGMPKAGGNVTVSADRDRDAYALFSGAQTVDTGYTPNSKTKLVVDFGFANAHNNPQQILFDAASGLYCRLYTQDSSGTNGKYSWIFNRSWGVLHSGIAVDHQRRLLTIDSPNNQSSLAPGATDGSTYNGDSTIAGWNRDATSAHTLVFGSLANPDANNGYMYAKARLYRLTIYDDGSKVREYVPCVIGGEPGLYDLVNGGSLLTASGLTVSGRGHDGVEEWITSPAAETTLGVDATTNFTARVVGALRYIWTRNGEKLDESGETLTVEWTRGDYFPPDAYTVTPIYDVFGEETKGATRSFAVSRVAPAFVITVR